MSKENLNEILDNREEVAENFFDCDSTSSNTESPKKQIERINEKFITHRQQYRDVNRYNYYNKNLLSQDIIQNQVEQRSSQVILQYQADVVSSQSQVEVHSGQINSQVQSSQFNFQDQVQVKSFQSQVQSSSSQVQSYLNKTQRVMSGTSPQVFESADPELRGWTADQLAYINARLTTEVTSSQRPIRVTNLNSRIDPPFYNPDTMTSASYFTKCEKYFQSQGCQEPQYHIMAHMIMKGNMLLWFDSVVDRINSWDDFKKEFKDRFDNANVQAKRNTLLYTRKQKFHESCEQFIQEMVTLARQINPTEDEHTSVKRAYEGLIPDIRCIAGNLDKLSVNSLLEILQGTYDTIRSRDRMYNTNTRLPPLYGYAVGSGPQFQSYGNRGGGRSGNFFRPRSYSLPQTTTSTSYGSFRPRTYQQPGNFQFQQRTFQPSNNSQFQQNQGTMQAGTSTQMQLPTPTPSSGFRQHQQFQQTGFRARSNSIPNANYKSSLKCHKCQQPGHFAKECSNNPGIVMAITGDANEHEYMQQQQQYEQQQQQPSTSAGSLNSQWRTSQSYGRGSSQY